MKRALRERRGIVALTAGMILAVAAVADAKPPPPATCGNGVAQQQEACDGNDLRNATCQSLGFAGGTLACSQGCRIDTSGCTTSDGSCDAALETCAADVSACEADRAECNDALATCNDSLSYAFPATGQGSAPFTGEDGSPAFGAPLSYRDNGDGTITDLNTGLVWEKKIRRDDNPDASNLNDADNVHPVRGTCSPLGVARSAPDCATDADCTVPGETCNTRSGAAVTTMLEWVAELNVQRFGGYDDWRIPNVKELQSIVDYGRRDPAIHPAFEGQSCAADCADLADPACGCTGMSTPYWSATSFPGATNGVFHVTFAFGEVTGGNEVVPRFVRAVRGGFSQ